MERRHLFLSTHVAIHRHSAPQPPSFTVSRTSVSINASTLEPQTLTLTNNSFQPCLVRLSSTGGAAYSSSSGSSSAAPSNSNRIPNFQRSNSSFQSSASNRRFSGNGSGEMETHLPWWLEVSPCVVLLQPSGSGPASQCELCLRVAAVERLPSPVTLHLTGCHPYSLQNDASIRVAVSVSLFH